jgi:ATPase subunit of ABC transporter with duplicated ATPase domains
MEYLQNHDITMMLVSHDRFFLGEVCTDTVVMEHQRLTYFPGNYWDYEQNQKEKLAMEQHILEASEKQRQKALEFVQKQQSQASKKSADPNKQRQAKMIKDKKMERIGNYRSDGKRYKNFSLKKLDESYLRTSEKVVVERDERVVQMKFPNPIWPSSVTSNEDNIITLDDVSFAYGPGDNKNDDKAPPSQLLNHLTLNVCRGSKIALVGRNGCGKSTLMKLLSGELGIGVDGSVTTGGGTVWTCPTIRIGYLSQYSVEELERYGEMTVVDFGEQHLSKGRASSRIISDGSGSKNVRQYLGAFGLGASNYAHRQIKTLSGGERMRLCFAKVRRNVVRNAVVRYTAMVVSLIHPFKFLSFFSFLSFLEQTHTHTFL